MEGELDPNALAVLLLFFGLLWDLVFEEEWE